MRAAWILLLAGLVVGCQSQQDDASAPDPAASSRSAREAGQEGGRADAEARREALRERLADLPAPGRDESRSETPARGAEAADSRRRARATVRWWEDEAIVGALGLSEQQVADIAQARADLSAALRRSRQALAEVSRGLREALAGAERDRARELLASRVEALANRARAEAVWTRRLLEILGDDQLEQMAEAYPPIVTSLFSPLR